MNIMTEQLFPTIDHTSGTILDASLNLLYRNEDAPSEVLHIEQLDKKLFDQYQDKIILQPLLNRQLVSFQDSKNAPAYRWYKYKEAYSARLVEWLLSTYQITKGTVFDPFAGTGTTLFASAASGLNAEGIELLEIGQEIISTRLLLEKHCTALDRERLRLWQIQMPWRESAKKIRLNTVRITENAYPKDTLFAIESFVAAMELENERVRRVLRFALLCILESISFTRKDGQYLRWDYRSPRTLSGKPFNKGEILTFDDAMTEKLGEILADTDDCSKIPELFSKTVSAAKGEICLFAGSCLEILPSLPDNSYAAVITSPPYCNRYDYTRTYALELALLGTDEMRLKELRQTMLSCTVENREKDLLAINPAWTNALNIAQNHELLQTILLYLEEQKSSGAINNSGIPRMVRGYFFEMVCVTAECFRTMQSGGTLFMVNDNVRYAGVSISVDLILSDIARKIGFTIREILVLPIGKGNSSQQMGAHGREVLRKCVYVWEKP
jgi:DNA modification methylase